MKTSLWLNVDPLTEMMQSVGSYIYTFNNPVKFVDPDGRKPYDWYENKTTGNVQWFNSSGTKNGYRNIGKSTNFVAGTGQGLILNSNGTAKDMNSGKSYGANKTVVVNSSTGTTVKTISSSESLANVSTLNTYIGSVGGPLAEYGSKSNIAGETFRSTVKGLDVGDDAINSLATLNKVSQFKGIANVVGKSSPFITVGVGILQVQEGYNLDGKTFGKNAKSATGGAVGGAVGGYLGAKGGAVLGGAIGVWFGGVGAVPGAIIGGVIGGIGGAILGDDLGKKLVK